MIAAANPRMKSQWMVELKFAQCELASIQELRQTICREQNLQRLREITGVTEEVLLDRLLEAGFHEKNIFALTWLPIALTAWASDGVSNDESEAARLVNLCSVLTGNPESAELFQHWLTVKPSEKLSRLWEDYVRCRIASGSDPTHEQTGQAILFMASKVAQASGGFMGLGQISVAERQVLDRIRAAYGLV